MLYYFFEKFIYEINYIYLYFLWVAPLFLILLFIVIFDYKYKIFKYFSLFFSLVIFLLNIGIILFYSFEFLFNFEFFDKIKWIYFFNFCYFIGIDGISFVFIILSTFLTFLCILLSWNSIKYNIKLYYIIIFLLEFLLLNVFLHLDLLFFYISFESILIPMFFLIGIWGSRYRKIHAIYLFLMYTLIGSLFFLISIIFVYFTFGSTEYFFLLNNINYEFTTQILIWFGFFFAFASKIPLIPVHIWLPEAHVEAPTSGSVFLAGILLKMGGYGILRFLLPFFQEANSFFLPFIFILCILSSIYISLITICQIDLKKIIAYSSIAHMSFVVLGLFVLNNIGLQASILLMLSHGLVSSGLFICIGFLYDRYGTRLIKYYKSLVQFMPLYAFFFFIFILANISFPGTSSFIGEFLIFVSVFHINIFVTIIISFSIIFGTIYSIWLYNRIFFGNLNIFYIYKYCDVNKREFFILFSLIIFVLFFGIYPTSISDFLMNNSFFLLELSYLK